jgi:uncharacterized membrane protein (UPF0127 family)
MPRLRPALSLCLTLAAVAHASAGGTAWSDPTPRPVATVTIRSGSAPLRVVASVADTEKARVRGLAGRTLTAGEGILYDFGDRRPVRMWTKDDRVPLDMAFLGDEGVVAYMRHDLAPGDETPVHSRVPVRYVLEVPAGTLEGAGVKVGDAVEIALSARDPAALPVPAEPVAAPPASVPIPEAPQVPEVPAEPVPLPLPEDPAPAR